LINNYINKFVTGFKKFDNKIKEAKNQIDKNNYYKELIDNKISKIIK